MESLRLLNGNDTHKACVEWITVDLATHKVRESISAIRGMKSLADELLVIAWLFPQRIRATSTWGSEAVLGERVLPCLFAAGYEVNNPEGHDWGEVVLVSCRGLAGDPHRAVDVTAVSLGDCSTFSTVPSLLK